ncbi:MAG: ABC transporter ATP-binding protein, partial [Kangiellaceae bacterium]|nr:ABC transporter ATP-binding protein [Kangiellaceae bacterium]
MSASLTLRQVSFKQAKRQTIFPTSITLPYGTRVAIVGLNGAGKTTLLKLIVGELKLTSGKIEYSNGRSLSQLIGTAQLGYQAADMDALSELTANEYLQLCCTLKNYSPTKMKHKISCVNEQWDLEKILGMPVKKLSQGNLRKLSIAQAFLGEPDFIILDEPTQALDPIEQERFITNLLGLEHHHLCLFSSHHISEAVRTAESVIMMHQGAVVACLELSNTRNFWIVSQQSPSDFN